jgi:hypothetical protein
MPAKSSRENDDDEAVSLDWGSAGWADGIIQGFALNRRGNNGRRMGTGEWGSSGPDRADERPTAALCSLCCLLLGKDRDVTWETCQFFFEQEGTEVTEGFVSARRD